MTRTITIIPAVLLLVAAATSVQAQAPSNPLFASHSYNNHTYHLLNLPRNHAEALQDVAEHAAWNTDLPNPYLLHLTTLIEKNAIEDWLAGLGAFSVWHGAEDSQFEGTWMYADGPAFYERDKSLFGGNCPNGVCWSQTGFWALGSPAIPPNLEDCMAFSNSSSQFRDERCDSLGPTVFVVLENGQTCLDYQTDGNPDLCPSVDYEEKPDFASIVCDNDVQLCSQTTCCVYVPEPSAGLMLSTGAWLLIALRRLRRRAG
jgi:hypothetical protein